MIKKLICVILLISISFSLFALDFTNAKPYTDDEFPELVLDLRRAEIIFFGGIPLAYPIVNLAMSSLGQETDFAKTMAIACSVSAVIAVADYVIGLIQD